MSLPSWHDTPRKQAILDFLSKSADKNSPDYIPPADRIAVNYPAMEVIQEKEHRTAEDGVRLLELAEPVEEWLGEINISDD